MDALDEHGEYDFHEWLEERLEEDLDVAAFREELEAWRPWVERSFDRKAANIRLRNLEAAG